MNRTRHQHEILPDSISVECAADTKSIAGESPVWSTREGCLYFVDHQGRKIHRYFVDGKLDTFDLPDIVTALAPRHQGGLIIALHQTFAFFDPDTGSLQRLANPEPDKEENRFNDGKCDQRGRFWCGTMGKQAWDEPVGTLYRLGSDLKPHAMVNGVRCSNGLGWSADGRTFYFAESFAYRIHAFDFDASDGTLSNKRVFTELDPSSGAFPDGLTIDAEGYLWNAQPVFGRLVRYDPEGNIDRIIEMPVSRPTSCIFGGHDMQTMFVTSAHETLTDTQIAEEPLAGGLFSFRPGVTGLPETPFNG